MAVMLPASVTGLYFCVTTEVDDPEDRWTEERFGILRTSIGTVARSIQVQDRVVIIMLSLHIMTIIAISFLYRHFRVRQKRLIAEVDKESITPSDFTVMLTNLPNVLTEEELQKYIEDTVEPTLRGQIVYITFAYRCNSFIEFSRKHQSLIQALRRLQNRPSQLGCCARCLVCISPCFRRLYPDKVYLEEKIR